MIKHSASSTDADIHITQLPSGPLCVSHWMPNVQTVSLGIFIDTGSRDETIEEAGMAHALEHMLFKGTQQLTGSQLNQAFDNLGGQVNAFTGRERTCYHNHTLHEDWPKALQLLLSMILEPALDEHEWQRERQVIFSEMGMVEDSPEEWLGDQHMYRLFSQNPLGAPTLGNKKSLLNINCLQLRHYLNKQYTAGNLLIVAAGRIDHQQFCQILNDQTWRHDVPTQQRQTPKHHHGWHLLPREMEQAQCMASWPCIQTNSKKRPQLWLANQILGGGMSSMLFQEVREKHGLAYQVASFYSTYSDTGCWSVACGTDKERLNQCIHLVNQTVKTWVMQNLNANDLAQAKRQLQIQLRMSMDSVEGNMLRLGNFLDESDLHPTQYWIDKVTQVTTDDIQQLIHQHFNHPPLWSIAAPQDCLDTLSLNN